MIKPEFERYLVPSIERAIEVLDILVREPQGLSLAELTRRTKTPKSTLFRILITMQKHGCVFWDEQARSYRLGQKLAEYGEAQASQTA